MSTSVNELAIILPGKPTVVLAIMYHYTACMNIFLFKCFRCITFIACNKSCSHWSLGHAQIQEPSQYLHLSEYPPAAMTGIFTASTTSGRISNIGLSVPRCPPASKKPSTTTAVARTLQRFSLILLRRQSKEPEYQLLFPMHTYLWKSQRLK